LEAFNYFGTVHSKKISAWNTSQRNLSQNCWQSSPTLSKTSWLNKRSRKCRGFPVHRTLYHVTFFYYQIWKCCWRGIGFKIWRRQNERRRRSCWLFKTVSFKSASDNGRTARTSVFGIRRGLILRGLGLQYTRLVSLFFPVLGRVLFDQATYFLYLKNSKTSSSLHWIENNRN
jgi:hypothetical protein